MNLAIAPRLSDKVGMAAHQEHLAKAMAAMMDMISHAQALQAAILRGAPAEEVEAMRQKGLATAEAYFDRSAEAAHAVKAITES